MPDPQRDLAPLIELPPPSSTSLLSLAKDAPWAHPDAGDWAIYALLLGATAVLILKGLALWRRRRPYHYLRQLTTETSPKAAADRLARLYPQLRGTPDRVWLSDLEHLRFAPPHADDAATLARLCVMAMHFPSR